jgi:hypothetical protein
MMKIIVSENQLRYLVEQGFPVKTPIIVKIFSLLNKEKKKKKKQSELLAEVENMLTYFGINGGYAKFLLELYILNYRQDGDYSFLTTDNYIDPRKQKPKKTSNSKSDDYTRVQLPFKGSNLEGYWSEDKYGVPYYVVKSYGWYPVYIFKRGKWYENAERFSSSTSKQMYEADPFSRYSENIDSKVYILSKEEMEMIQDGADHNKVMKNKISSLEKDSQNFLSKRKQSSTFFKPDLYERYKVQYKIESIDIVDGKGVVTINIYDVWDENRPTETDRLNSITKDRIESELKRSLIEKLKKYVGSKVYWGKEIPDDLQVEFRFNHLHNKV